MKQTVRFILAEVIGKTVIVVFGGTFFIYSVMTMLLSAYGLERFAVHSYIETMKMFLSPQNLYSDYFPGMTVAEILSGSLGSTLLLCLAAAAFAVPFSLLTAHSAVLSRLRGAQKGQRGGAQTCTVADGARTAAAAAGSAVRAQTYSVRAQSMSVLITVLCSLPSFSLCYISYGMGTSVFPYIAGGIIIALGSGIVYDMFLSHKKAVQSEFQKEYMLNLYISGVKTGSIFPFGRTMTSAAFANSLPLTVPFFVQRIPLIVGETIIIEVIFRLPGLGKTFMLALAASDVPVLIGTTLMYLLIIRVLSISALALLHIVNPHGKE